MNIDTEDYIDAKFKSIEEYLESFAKEARRNARSYIENNVDLLDTDAVKFFDGCPTTLFMDVVTKLNLAGIDCSEAMKKHFLNITERAIKNSGIYLHDYDTHTFNTLKEVTRCIRTHQNST